MNYKDGFRILLEARNKGLIDNFSMSGDDTWVGAQLDAESNAVPLLELLDKDTPKDLIYEGDGYDEEGNMVYDYAHCPTCDRFFEEGCNDWGRKYCPDCGQKLDWR